ncbi:MAG: serine O-acetyltransferase EpsC [Planctomycetota bacterium]
MLRQELNDALPATVRKLVDSVHEHPTLARLNLSYLPSREVVCDCTDRLLELAFPGYFGEQGITEATLPFRVGEQVAELMERLYEPIRYCFRYRENKPGCEDTERRCDAEAVAIVQKFFDLLPAVRAKLATDVQAAFDSDPAATSTDETIFSYPGLLAIAVQRLAHELYLLNVPLLPRVMTEYAHSRTGVDIHPGATIGDSFFIDHGTGVVIGETCAIGTGVKVYQGVTLGALAPAFGQMIRGTKRHPTIEDNVVVYAGATILGGDTVIGQGCTIGGNVFITESVPPRTTVTAEPPSLRYRERGKKRRKDEAETLVVMDYQI